MVHVLAGSREPLACDGVQETTSRAGYESVRGRRRIIRSADREPGESAFFSRRLIVLNYGWTAEPTEEPALGSALDPRRLTAGRNFPMRRPAGAVRRPRILTPAAPLRRREARRSSDRSM